MYSSFYNLDKKPFERTPDPSFLWLGEKHKKAFSTLLCGILDNKGFVLLTGDAGSGKTTLLKAFAQSLEEDVEWAVIADPSLERLDFYNLISSGYGIKTPFTSKVQFLIQFSHFLHKTAAEKKKVLLLVDDCHRLSQEMLEELRLLSNIEKEDIKLLNIFFVGQPEFNDLLSQPKNRAVKQRLTLIAELPSLDVNETADYIRHRLKIAGTEEVLFTAKAVQVVHRFTQGIPRRINSICDRALLTGSAQSIQSISDKVIEACIRKMDLSVNSSQEELDTFTDEKKNLNYHDQRFIPKPAHPTSSFSGFNHEKDPQGSWLKYGFGILVPLSILVVGIYFGFPRFPMESAHKDPVEVIEAPVVKTVSEVSTSPALTMLEVNKNEINDKKAAELKTAILEKTYSGNNTTKEMNNPQAEKMSDETGAPAVQLEQPVEEAGVTKVNSLSGQNVSGQLEGSEQAIAQEQPPLEENSAEGTGMPEAAVLQNETSEKVLEAPIEDAPVDKQEVAKIAHMEPRKIILGLQPNSLKLTNAAQKEFDNYILKLKLYPLARVQVKGFVSAKTNSPENIKLSRDRAMSVQKLMLAKGMNAEQIEVVGMGNQEPIAPNNTSKGRRENRRVEIIVIDDGI